MKAITIRQPWASLIAIGAKHFETRGWKTNYRGPIAIHAGKRKEYDSCMMLARQYTQIWRQITPMKFGEIVAIANLSNCYEIHADHSGGAALMTGQVPVWFCGKDSDEITFGIFMTGRFAWELTNVKMLDEPIPAKGQQGLWNWNCPWE